MNPYLDVLVRPHRAFAMYGDEPVRAVALTPDPERQSPRIYAALASGGGVLFDEEAAQKLSAAGFVVTAFVPTPEERSYLVTFDDRFAPPPRLWLVACVAGEAVDVSGRGRTCRLPGGLQRVDLQTAQAHGTIRQSDLDAPKTWAQKIMSYVVLGTDRTPNVAEVESAKAMMRKRAQLAHLVTQMEDAARVSGIPMSASVRARWESAVRFLAQTAQPAQVFESVYGPAVLGGAFGAVQAGYVLAAVVVLGIAAAVVYLAYMQGQTNEQFTQLTAAHQTQLQQLSDCVSDPAVPGVQRTECRKALKSLSKAKPTMPAQWHESLGKATPWIAGVALAGMAAVYFGPALREATSTAASQLKSFRQRRQATRKQITGG